MTISGLSEFDCDSLVSIDNDDKSGSLDSRVVTQENTPDIAFLSFEKKCPHSCFHSKTLAMTRCSKIELDAYGKDQYGNSVGIKLTIYGDEDRENSSVDSNQSPESNCEPPDSRDRDFDKDSNGTW